MSFDLDKCDNQTIFILDLGEMIFNVSILKVRDDVFEVLVTLGAKHLGMDNKTPF